MIKPILTAAALSLAAATAAWALPVSTTAPLPPLDSSDLIQVGHGYGHGGGKNYNKNYNKHYNYNYNRNYNYKHGGGRYYYHNRYWGHRYNYRPYNWQALGCIIVGPVWYCP
ncbi:hypothetical protein [Methyloceanibacter sp.]|uniref:hypothetical protein n=1 Tax=Methyloceanibacter sp. TaxID=1965321 RepID=UPI003D6CCD8F